MARMWIRPRKEGGWERTGSSDELDLSKDGWQEVDAAGMEGVRKDEERRRLKREAEDDFRQGAKAMGKAQDFGDAKRDGLSNPTARPEQDWSDGPRNPSPMPPARARPSVSVGRVETGDPEGFVGRQAAAGRRAPGGMERLSQRHPQVAAYMQQRMQPQEDGLGEARARADRGTLFARLGRAGAMANEALTGARFDRAAYDDLEAGAQQPVQDFMTRRGMAQEDEQGRRAREEAQLRAEDTRRRWGNADRDDAYRRERDTAGDELARQRMAADERRAGQDNAYRWASLKEQRSSRAAMEQARAEERQAAAAAKEGQMRERQDEKDMAELGKRTDKLTQTKSDVEHVNGLLRDGGDIPGAGVWDSLKMENDFTRALFASPEDIESWQASQRMAANYLNTMTGQSFTPLEATRTLQRYGVRPGATEQEWRSGMTAFIRDVKSGLVQKEAPFKHVVPEFRERGGVTAEDIPEPAQQGPRPTGRTKRTRDGRVFMEMSDGSAVEVPRG